jgi:hypothetical protein
MARLFLETGVAVGVVRLILGYPAKNGLVYFFGFSAHKPGLRMFNRASDLLNQRAVRFIRCI